MNEKVARFLQTLGNYQNLLVSTYEHDMHIRLDFEKRIEAEHFLEVLNELYMHANASEKLGRTKIDHNVALFLTSLDLNHETMSPYAVSHDPRWPAFDGGSVVFFEFEYTNDLFGAAQLLLSFLDGDLQLKAWNAW